MQRIAGMTVVHAEGVPEAVYNGQRDKVVDAIREEMERQKAAMCAEMEHMKAELEREIQVERDRADINSANCCKFRSRELMQLSKPTVSPVRRALRRIGNAYALSVGTLMCLPEIAEALGYWKNVRKEHRHEKHKRADFTACRQRSKEPRRRAGVC